MDSEFQKSCSTDFSEENWGHISPGRYCWTEGMHTYTWIYIHYYNTYYRVNDSSLLYILIVLVTLSFSTLFYRVLFPCPGGLHGKYSCKHVSAIEKSMIKPWDFNSFFFFFPLPFLFPVSEMGFRMQLVRFLSGIADTDTTYIFCICITQLRNSDNLFQKDLAIRWEFFPQ